MLPVLEMKRKYIFLETVAQLKKKDLRDLEQIIG